MSAHQFADWDDDLFVESLWGSSAFRHNEGADLYCDYCETDGHTFRSCPARDDNWDAFNDPTDANGWGD